MNQQLLNKTQKNPVVNLAFTAFVLVFTPAILWFFQAREADSNTASYTGAIRYIACPMIAAHNRIECQTANYFFFFKRIALLL
jgi:hypothetical protein